MSGGKVLVFGDDTQSFLATVRSLGRRGVRVEVAPGNFRSPALRSRYIAAIHILPPWMGDGSAWLTSVYRLLRTSGYDLVMPCNETALLPLQRHRSTLSALARLAMPDDLAIDTLFDKHATRTLARRAGVPVAYGRLVWPDDTAAHVLAEFGTPLIVKPRRSYALDNLSARGKVEVVGDIDRLARLLDRCWSHETLLERCFNGKGIGVSVLASRGRVLQAFEHHRAREVAGASFYRFSAPVTPELGTACAAIVEALGYTGVAMFEFKVDSSGRWILLEVNARPWGSMPLPVALGIDFPYRWYRLLTAGEESDAVSYPAGVYARNLVPDLRNSLIEAEARRLGCMATAWFMLGRMAELPRVLIGREVNDVLVRDDIRPGAVELLGLVRAAQRKVCNILPGATARRRRAALAQVAGSPNGPHTPSILFVCQGNICRSPFAAALLRTRLNDRGIVVHSAGMLPQPGRPSPAFALAAAAALGFDLSAHRSLWLDRRMAEAASLLIVFDDITREAVLDRYPHLSVPIVHLGHLAGLGDIADPVDGGAADFAQIYSLIATAISELALLLSRPRLGGALYRASHEPKTSR